MAGQVHERLDVQAEVLQLQLFHSPLQDLDGPLFDAHYVMGFSGGRHESDSETPYGCKKVADSPNT